MCVVFSNLIFCLMCSDNKLHALCILPFGMWCLSASRTILMITMFAVCGLMLSFFCEFYPVCFLVVSVN